MTRRRVTPDDDRRQAAMTVRDHPLVIDRALTLEDVASVAEDGRAIELSDAARTRIVTGRRTVERLLGEGATVYGLTTGVGAMKRVAVGAAEQERFNRLLLRAHRTGTGPPAPDAVVRAALLAQLAGFAQGHAGVRESLADLLVSALNAGLMPRARVTGSLGQSDLGPLADIAQALTGEDEWGAQLDRHGLQPWRPDAKEALAFVNSNAFSLGWSALALSRVQRLLIGFDQAAALTFEGMLGNVQALDPEVAVARPVPGLREEIDRMRALLAGGSLLGGTLHRELQDPLVMRAVPQTHGAAYVALAHARRLLESELVSSHDNPCITTDGRALSNGNFDSVPYGIALDYVRLAVAHVLTASCERAQKLVHRGFSGLPTGLRGDDSSNADGLAIVVYGAAAAAAEARLLAMPATLETPTTSVAEGIEDRIIPTPVAARRLDQQVDLAAHVAATELYVAAQAVDLRARAAELGRGTASAYAMVRRFAPALEDGQAGMPDLGPLVAAVMQGHGDGEVSGAERPTGS
jgi:histidine ammonia-lyase